MPEHEDIPKGSVKGRVGDRGNAAPIKGMAGLINGDTGFPLG